MDESAIRGVPWTLLTYVVSKSFLLASTVVLARLLVPGEFGLVALATLVVGLLGIFSDLGLSGALVVRQDLDERGKGTVFTLMVLMGALTAAVVAACGPLAAAVFDEPRLAGVVAVLALIQLTGGFNWFYDTVLFREFAFRRFFVTQVSMSVAFAAVAITLAALGAGVWSLVVGQVAGQAVNSLMLFSVAPYRARPAFDRAVARDVLQTSRGFIAQGGAEYVQENADYVAVGIALNPAQLGFYSMAYRLSDLTYRGIAEPVQRVTFPAFARMRHEQQDVTESFLSVLRLVALVCCPLGALLSAAADPFTLALFGEKWALMIGPLAVLGVWAALRPVASTVAWLLNSIGKANLTGAISVGLLGPLAALTIVAASGSGITAVSWVVLGHMLAYGALACLLAVRRAGIPATDLAGALRPVAFGTVATWAATRVVADLTASAPPGVGLLAAAAAGLAAYPVVLSLAEPGILRAAWRQGSRTLVRRSEALRASP